MTTALQLELRLDNKGKGAKYHCAYCCQHKGWVFMGWSGVGTDQMAPCPYCLAGYYVEFPRKGKDDKVDPPPPWGHEGYWRGRDIDGVEKACDCHVKPALPAENREQLKKLTATLASVGREIG